MTFEEAVAALYQCPSCRRWITTPTCDGCRVDRLPDPSVGEAVKALNEAIELGKAAARLRTKLAGMLGAPGTEAG